MALALFGVTFGPARLNGVDEFLLQTSLVLPLAWRRRAPLLVFGVIGIVAFEHWLLDAQLPGDAALLIALYTVAAHSPSRPGAVLAGTALAVGALLAAMRWAPPDRTLAAFVVMMTMIIAAAALGTNTRTKKSLRVALREGVIHLELERDQLSRLAVAKERARVAREMHDIVTHNLSVIIALADATV